MANELAAKGINANAIAPGYMATDNTAPLRADTNRANAILERIPAGRWGMPMTSKVRWFFWPPRRPTTSTAPRWQSMAAGWRDKIHA